MPMHSRIVLQSLLGLAAMAWCAGAQAQDMTPYQECWKGEFTEQFSGNVRVKTNTGGPSGDFMSSYDGDFRWVGEPKRSVSPVTYTYCFHAREDDGGAILMTGKTIAMQRVGSRALPGGRRSVMGNDVTVVRDPDVFTALYAVFQTPGQEPTSLEVSLDREKQTTTVTTLTTRGKQRTLVHMKGDAVRVRP